jgi:hypothetical protein
MTTLDTKPLEKASGATNANGLHADANSTDSPSVEASIQTNTQNISVQEDFALTATTTEPRIDSRRLADMRRNEYLPSYRQLQEAIHAVSATSSNEGRVHMNVAKLINKAVGIEPGQRASAPIGKQALLIVAQQVTSQTIYEACDHHDCYQRAKQSMQALSALTLQLTVSPASTRRSA